MADHSTLKQIRARIAGVRIQGATDVARATLAAVSRYARQLPAPRRANDWRRLSRAAAALAAVRPTEPLARNLVRWYLAELQRYAGNRSRPAAWHDYTKGLERALSEYLNEADGTIAKNGQRLVRSGQIIFTHCHSSLVEHILVEAHKRGRKFHVYHTETRPRFQGRITERKLQRAHIRSTMVSDSAAAWLVSKRSGDDVDVTWVLLGADSIARDGSIMNKVGSFGIVLAARDSRIPVYVASTLLKVDWWKESKIELRSAPELWPHAPRGTNLVNYTFDRVPAAYITGIICEFGIIKPRQVSRLVRRHYAWLTTKS